MRVLQTSYNGYRFRSRLEARYAVFFDTLKVPFEYEKEGFEVNGTCYLPDFYLPTVSLRSHPRDGVWFEVKGAPPTEAEQARLAAVGAATETPAVIVRGLWEPATDVMWECAPFWDNYMQFMKCYRCGHLKIEFFEGNYCVCPRCQSGADARHHDIASAVARAKGARF